MTCVVWLLVLKGIPVLLQAFEVGALSVTFFGESRFHPLQHSPTVYVHQLSSKKTLSQTLTSPQHQSGTCAPPKKKARKQKTPLVLFKKKKHARKNPCPRSLTASLPLKIGAWKRILTLLGGSF